MPELTIRFLQRKKSQLETAEGSGGQTHKKRLMAVTITAGSAAEAAAA